MTPEFVTTDNPEHLLQFQEQIFLLFKKCFLRDMDIKLWKWLYFQNPVNTPVISLAFVNNTLVGHYAFVASKLNSFRAYTSITLMIDPSIQNPWIFLGMMQNALNLLQSKTDIVLAFPNKNSFPLFTKMLKWNLIPTFIAQVDTFTFKEYQHKIHLDTNDSDFLRWRLSKPNNQYFYLDKTIAKIYQKTEIDVVFSASNTHLAQSEKKYNILTNETSLIDKKTLDYPFVYYVTNQKLNKTLDIKPDLLMSDVF